MTSMWLLVGIAALAAGNPQSREMPFTSYGEYGAGADNDGLEEFYDNQDAKIWLPGEPDNSYDNPDYSYGNPDYSQNNQDYSYGNQGDSDNVVSDYEDYDLGASIEPSTFASNDYLELPDWMDIDFNKLPLDKLQLLNNASDLTDLTAIFDLKQKDADKLSVRQINGTQTESRSSGLVEKTYENPVFARCEPEKVKVLIGEGYIPNCVRLMRCGGCCFPDTLLSCQPTKSENVTLRVTKITRVKKSVRGKRSLAFTFFEKENHLECGCECKVQEKHCNPALHDYKPDECACICKDKQKKIDCEGKRLQRWDNDTCNCICRETKQCGTGEIFSQDNCKCQRADRISVGTP